MLLVESIVMELRQLKYFVTVASTLNFSEAARKLYITQGTLSQQIKQLEGELGAELFERSSHSVRLTEAGTELLPLAQQTLTNSEQCILKINDLRQGLTGTLNIGVTHSFANLLTSTVKVFLKQHPKVHLNIYYKTATELHEMLRAGLVDFIVAFTPAITDPEVESELLIASQLSAVMWREHPLADRKSLTLEDISRYGIALPGSGLQSRRAFDRFNNIDTSKLDVRVELNEPNVLMNIVNGTMLIGIMSSLAVHYNPNLIAIPLEGLQREMLGCVHWLRSAYRKRSALTFISMLQDQ